MYSLVSFFSAVAAFAIVQQDIDYAMNQTFKLFLLNHNNTITIFCPQLHEPGTDYLKKQKTSPSITAFKLKLNKDIKKPPQYYYCGKRLGQIHHTRLRLNCSSLHQNLFSKNIIHDPHCECGEIEDTEHYLLNCNIFQNLREELLNTVTTYCQPTLNVLLYGNANLSESENKTIFFCSSRIYLED